MSQENVEIVKELFDAWKGRDAEKALKRIDPEIEVDFTQVSQVPVASARGAEGLQRMLADWFEAWGSLDWFPQNFIAAVIVWLLCTAQGRESGVPVEIKVAVVYTLRDGRVVGFHGYDSLGDAANAVGI